MAITLLTLTQTTNSSITMSDHPEESNPDL